MTDKIELLCTNGLEHRIGQQAVDSGHGARPTGPQICLVCKKNLRDIVDQYAQEREAAALKLQKARYSNIEGLVHGELVAWGWDINTANDVQANITREVSAYIDKY